MTVGTNGKGESSTVQRIHLGEERTDPGDASPLDEICDESQDPITEEYTLPGWEFFDSETAAPASAGSQKSSHRAKDSLRDSSGTPQPEGRGRGLVRQRAFLIVAFFLGAIVLLIGLLMFGRKDPVEEEQAAVVVSPPVTLPEGDEHPIEFPPVSPEPLSPDENASASPSHSAMPNVDPPKAMEEDLMPLEEDPSERTAASGLSLREEEARKRQECQYELKKFLNSATIKNLVPHAGKLRAQHCHCEALILLERGARMSSQRGEVEAARFYLAKLQSEIRHYRCAGTP
ncbi:MAG TPA: hypothetical protein VNA24_31355 [Hyalangium sp.]|nr:hypothetical protein [Hyalangium sp.]